MKTVETENEGLKRAFMLTIPAKDIDARVEQELKRSRRRCACPASAPARCPPTSSARCTARRSSRRRCRHAVQEGVQQLLDRAEAAPGDAARGRARRRLCATARTPRSRSRSKTLPDVPEPQDRRPEARAADGRGRRGGGRRADRSSSPARRRAGTTRPRRTRPPTGDLVVIDFVGKVDGEAFEGGTGEGMSVELGSGRLIPGFEDAAGRRQGGRRARRQGRPSRTIIRPRI